MERGKNLCNGQKKNLSELLLPGKELRIDFLIAYHSELIGSGPTPKMRT